MWDGMSIRLFVALLSVGCGGCTELPEDVGTTVQVVDSLGTMIVRNRGPDVALEWNHDVEFLLGGEDREPEAFFQLTSGDVDVDAAGNIYVIDRTVNLVRVFDPQGGFQRSVGGAGQGPGEFVFPIDLAVDRLSEALRIYDVGTARFTDFTLDGELLSTTSSPRMLSGMSFQADAFLMGQIEPGVPEGIRSLRLMRSSGDTVTLIERPLPSVAFLDLNSCGMRLPSYPPVFAPSAVVWAANEEQVAVAEDSRYEIAVSFVDGTQRLLRREQEPIRPNSDLAVESLLSTSYVEEHGCDPEEIVQLAGIAEEVSLIQTLRVAPDGALWAQRWTGPAEHVLDVFDQEGGYLGTLPEEFGMPVAFLPDGRVIMIATDELGIDRLRISRILR